MYWLNRFVIQKPGVFCWTSWKLFKFSFYHYSITYFQFIKKLLLSLLFHLGYTEIHVASLWNYGTSSISRAANWHNRFQLPGSFCCRNCHLWSYSESTVFCIDQNLYISVADFFLHILSCRSRRTMVSSKSLSLFKLGTVLFISYLCESVCFCFLLHISVDSCLQLYAEFP